MSGTIVTWLGVKKFGFIRPDGWEEDLFLHLQDLPDRQPLPVNTGVSFELGVYGGRQKAIRVREVDDEPEAR